MVLENLFISAGVLFILFPLLFTIIGIILEELGLMSLGGFMNNEEDNVDESKWMYL